MSLLIIRIPVKETPRCPICTVTLKIDHATVHGNLVMCKDCFASHNVYALDCIAGRSRIPAFSDLFVIDSGMRIFAPANFENNVLVAEWRKSI